MRRAPLSVLLIGLSACVAQAGDFKWNSGPVSRQWMLPSETTTAAATKPTTELRPTIPPELRRARRAAGNVSSSPPDIHACGVLYGLSDNPFTCGPSSVKCYSNTEYSAFGCCSGTGCSSTKDLAVQTTCLDSTEAQPITTPINGYTGLCTNADNPYCMTLQYQDMPGYSVFGCTDSPSLTMLIYYDMSAPTANPSMVVAPSASNSTDKSDDGDSGSGTNYGAVIGGVVAGVALGLVIIIAALCLRRKPIRRRAAQNSTTGTAVSHPGGYQRAPQTPGSDMVPFQYRLSNFSADAGMGMKSSRPYSMSSYGMYDSSLRDFHEGLSPRSQSPASPGPFSMRSGRRPGSSRPGSSRPESMAAPPRLSISEIAGTQLDANVETHLHLWKASIEARLKTNVQTPLETRFSTPIKTRFQTQLETRLKAVVKATPESNFEATFTTPKSNLENSSESSSEDPCEFHRSERHGGS